MIASGDFWSGGSVRLAGRESHGFNELNEFKLQFQLHEGHAFRNNDQRYKCVAQELSKVVDRFMRDLIDTQTETMVAIFGNEFAFLSMDLLNKVVQFLQKRLVLEVFGSDPGECFP